jgi:hypothetical protein
MEDLLIVLRHRATLQARQDSHERVWEWEVTDVTQIAEKYGVLGIEFKVRGSNAPPKVQTIVCKFACKCT